MTQTNTYQQYPHENYSIVFRSLIQISNQSFSTRLYKTSKTLQVQCIGLREGAVYVCIYIYLKQFDRIVETA